MPLPIAHGLLGAVIARIIHPNADSRNPKPLIFGFVLANCPDLDFGFSFLFGWHDFHRGLTHSLMFAILITAVIFIWRRKGNWQISLAYSAAFLSHTILDYLCAKFGGVRLFIPFSNDAYGLGIIGFSELTNGFNAVDIIFFSLIETLIFVPFFLLIIFFIRRANRFSDELKKNKNAKAEKNLINFVNSTFLLLSARHIFADCPDDDGTRHT